LYFALSPSKNENVSYGLNFSDKFAREMNLDWKQVFNTMVEEMPTKKYRLVVYWDDVEKNPGEFDYSNIKYQLDTLKKYPESEVILVVGRKVIRYPECHEPNWWREIPSENEKKKRILSYLERTVTELKNYESIKYWQVENEALFPFGYCTPISNLREFLIEEVELVRKLDPTREIIIQDSGEGGFWFLSDEIGDYLGISIYRKVWFDFLGILTDQFSFPLKYPIGPAFYKIKAFLLGVPFEHIKATEVQAEPWGPVRNDLLTKEDIDKTMSEEDFMRIFEFNKKTGFSEFHLWGVEWWYHQKYVVGHSFYWDYAKNEMSK
jgi:hypothetical protein